MAAPCGTSLHVCRMRGTLLDDFGNPSDVADNSVVISELTSVGVNPNVAQGADIEQRGGCDCVVASYKGVDSLKRFDFVLTQAKMIAALQGFFIGGTIITGMDGTAEVPIGVAFPGPLDCDDTPTNVAFEFWTDHWNGSAIDPTWPYIHFIWPQSRWQIGPASFANEFASPVLNGFSKQNLAWDDPYGDGPGVDVTYGAWYYTADALPEPSCELQTLIIP